MQESLVGWYKRDEEEVITQYNIMGNVGVEMNGFAKDEYDNAKGTRPRGLLRQCFLENWRVRRLPLTAQMTARDVLYIIGAIVAVFYALSRSVMSPPIVRRVLTTVRDEALELTTSFVPNDHNNEDIVRLNLFPTQLVMNDASKDRRIMNACRDVSNLVIDKYLSIRRRLIEEIKTENRERLSADGQTEQAGDTPSQGRRSLQYESSTHTPEEDLLQGALDFLYPVHKGYALNDAFYFWQMEQRAYGEDEYKKCMDKNNVTTSTYWSTNCGLNCVCNNVIEDNEWPELYSSEAYKTLAEHVLQFAERTTEQGRVNRELITESEGSPRVGPRHGIIDVWFSVHSPGVFHGEHNHENSSLAGTFYLQSTGDSGRITYLDPRKPHSYALERFQPETPGGPRIDEYGLPVGEEMYLFENGRRGVSVYPKEGLLIFFPPWLYHQVQPTVQPGHRTNLGTHTQIGASGEVISKEKDKLHETEPVWMTDTNRTAFRVAMSFNIGFGWNNSVDFSLIDSHEKHANALLRSNSISPTYLNESTWMYHRDDELRSRILRSVDTERSMKVL